MQSKKEISQAVAELIDSGMSEYDPASSKDDIGLKADDIYPSLRQFFTDKAAKVLHIKTSHLIHQRNELIPPVGTMELLAKLNIRSARAAIDSGKVGYRRVIDIVNFIGCTSSKENLGAAVSKVILTINDLAEREYITAALAPLSIIELHSTAGLENKYCIVSYLAIKQDGQLWVDQNLQNITFKEGAIPTNIKDLK